MSLQRSRAPWKSTNHYFGGKRKNMSTARRKATEGMGRGPVGKTAVVGAKDRETGQIVARVIERTDKETLQGFVDDHTDPDAPLCTDDATAYQGFEPEARDGQAQRSRIRPVPRKCDDSYQRDRVVLVHAETSPQGASTTGYPQSTCRPTSTCSQAGRTSGSWTRWPRSSTS